MRRKIPTLPPNTFGRLCNLYTPLLLSPEMPRPEICSIRFTPKSIYALSRRSFQRSAQVWHANCSRKPTSVRSLDPTGPGFSRNPGPLTDTPQATVNLRRPKPASGNTQPTSGKASFSRLKGSIGCSPPGSYPSPFFSSPSTPSPVKHLRLPPYSRYNLPKLRSRKRRSARFGVRR